MSITIGTTAIRRIAYGSTEIVRVTDGALKLVFNADLLVSRLREWTIQLPAIRRSGNNFSEQWRLGSVHAPAAFGADTDGFAITITGLHIFRFFDSQFDNLDQEAGFDLSFLRTRDLRGVPAAFLSGGTIAFTVGTQTFSFALATDLTRISVAGNRLYWEAANATVRARLGSLWAALPRNDTYTSPLSVKLSFTGTAEP